MSNSAKLLKAYSKEIGLPAGQELTLEQFIDSHRNQRKMVRQSVDEFNAAVNKAVEIRMEQFIQNDVITRDKLLAMSVLELADFLKPGDYD